ncbi:hypothetical protein HDU97_003766 [Phlyctochytrium planicorne]|nr:hypothetical protein HDU97_003766 [Phlyctochytrium planicorne]
MLLQTLILTSLFITSTLATEIIYLTDCIQNRRNSDGTGKTILQPIMVYYPDASKSLGQIPTENQYGIIIDSNGSVQTGRLRWEVWRDLPDNSQEQYITGQFRDGNHVKAYINADAKSWPTDTVVGNAVNDNGKWFTCRKDLQDGHILFDDRQADRETVCYLRYRCEV